MDYIQEILLDAGQEPDTEFNHFEPWDVLPRSEHLLKYADDLNIKLDPNGGEFQTGMLMSTVFIAIAIAGNQLGKTFGELVECIIQATGELPISLRYEKGVDTGIPRNIADGDRRVLNILRFGRRCVKTGEIIDHCPYLKADGTPTDFEAEAVKKIIPDETWDCGNIVGAGIYPSIKMPENKTLIRVCSWKQARDDMWEPALKRMWPKELRDISRGTDGFVIGDNTFHSHNGTTVKLITYESGYESMEAAKPWLTILDEEPKDRRFYTGALTHSKYIRMSFTPIHGLSWSKIDLIDKVDKNVKVFRATQFDCPFKTIEGIERETSTMKSWEKISKVLGYHAGQTGMPYFDREKINGWINGHVGYARSAEFRAEAKWTTGLDIPNLDIKLDYEIEEVGQATWQISEDVDVDASYYLAVDTASGIENEAEANDIDYTSMVMMRVCDGEVDTPVAFIKTLIPEIYSWREALLACGYYNNALLCPEATGETGALFLSRSIDYPYIVKSVVIRQATRQPEEKLGFQMRKNTRAEVFKLLLEWEQRYDSTPRFPFLSVINEMSECIVSKQGRPDHPRGSNNDSLVAFGIGLWVKANAVDQCRNNRRGKAETIRNRDRIIKTESRPLIGSSLGLDEMERLGYIS